MTREMIIRELENRGYKVTEKDVVKNNTIQHAFEFAPIQIENYGVAPLIYPDKLIQMAESKGWSIEDVVEELIKAYENMDIEEPADICKIIHNREFVLSCLFIGMERRNTLEETDYLKKEFEYCNEIEEYLYLRIQQNECFANVKVTEEILQTNGINVKEAWEQAEKNTCAEKSVLNMSMFGADSMLILTNKERFRGASQIINKEEIQNIKNAYNVEHLVILPSSIHECIIIPKTEDIELEELSFMVKEINESTVNVEEQLADRAFII